MCKINGSPKTITNYQSPWWHESFKNRTKSCWFWKFMDFVLSARYTANLICSPVKKAEDTEASTNNSNQSNRAWMYMLTLLDLKLISQTDTVYKQPVSRCGCLKHKLCCQDESRLADHLSMYMRNIFTSWTRPFELTPHKIPSRLIYWQRQISMGA